MLKSKYLTLTIKMLLHCHSFKQADDLDKTAIRYTEACNYISHRYFENDCKSFTKNVHHNLYYSIRSLFGLKAEEAGSVFRTVKARYRAVKTQLYYQVNRYKDKYTKQTFYVNKRPEDMWHPIRFKRPQITLQRKNDWSFVSRKLRVSINTINKRDKLTYYIPKYFRRYTKAPWKYGTAHYLKSGSKRYLHISVKAPVSVATIRHIVGSDRGQRFTVYSYDGKHSSQIRGLSMRRKRSRFLGQRASLQHRGTRSAKRKLKRISGRENCWMNTMNHRITKALVRQYPKDTAYVLENLRGVKFEAMNAPKQDRYSRATWTFYQLGQDLAYKAKLNRDTVIHVNPEYTSQRCPSCGHVLAISRSHRSHVYHCKFCGYTSNDDRIGAMNIRFLGKLQLLGYNRPFIKKDNQIGYHKKVNKKNRIKYLSRLDALKIAQRPLENSGVLP